MIVIDYAHYGCKKVAKKCWGGSDDGGSTTAGGVTPAQAEVPTISDAEVAGERAEDKKARLNAEAEVRKRKEEEAKRQVEKAPYVYTGPLYRIDDYVSAQEGTAEERRKLVQEVLDDLANTTPQSKKDSQGGENIFFEKRYPLVVDGTRYEIIATVHPDIRLFALAVVNPLQPDNTALVLHDAGATGTPSAHQLPVQLQDKVLPQGHAVFSESELANKVYRGLLTHILSKF